MGVVGVDNDNSPQEISLPATPDIAKCNGSHRQKMSNRLKYQSRRPSPVEREETSVKVFNEAWKWGFQIPF